MAVVVKEIDPEKRRISLSLRDAAGDPWLEAAEKFSPGQTLEGVLEKKEKFGYFITLEPGVTGLMPRSTLARHRNPAQIEKLKVGDSVPVVVEAVNAAERKITLAPAGSAGERDWQGFVGDSASSLGVLGEKLRQAMERKKD